MRPPASPCLLDTSTFANLPRFWTADHAQRVFAALDASGLSVGAFARATGLSPTRLGPTYRARMARRLGVSLGETAPAPVRLVEVVARQEIPTRVVPRVELAPRVLVETPGGWRLDVPGELLAELVNVLGARRC